MVFRKVVEEDETLGKEEKMEETDIGVGGGCMNAFVLCLHCR